ncbi:MAG: hypothetical protein ACLR8Y_01955 [Alistipes indistinctus]
MVTVDGTPTLKVKYDILGLKGITAYADGTPSGGFSGALVDLVDVAVTNLASGDILKVQRDAFCKRAGLVHRRGFVVGSDHRKAGVFPDPVGGCVRCTYVPSGLRRVPVG